MKMDAGKYRGKELSELQTAYLEWGLGHLALGAETALGVQAELARRRNSARVEAQTPAARTLGRVGRPINRLTARLHSWLLSRRRAPRA